MDEGRLKEINYRISAVFSIFPEAMMLRDVAATTVLEDAPPFEAEAEPVTI